MKPIFHANIEVETLEQIVPHGDYVLVKRLPDPETIAGGLLFLPDGSRDPKKLVPRRGLVIAVGKGDRWHGWVCTDCIKIWDSSDDVVKWGQRSDAWKTFEGRKVTTQGGPGHCELCGGTNFVRTDEGRHEMHVKPGDHVIYWRSPANDVKFNDTEYVFLHEEQHIAAVIPQEAEIKLGPLQNDRPVSRIRRASEILDKLAS